MHDVLTLYNNERYRSEEELLPFHNFELVTSDYPKRNSFHYQIENAEHSSFFPSLLAVTQAVPPSSAKCSRKRNQQGTGALYEGK